jgi:hypothetical protein
MYAILYNDPIMSSHPFCAGVDKFKNTRMAESPKYAKKFKTERSADNFLKKNNINGRTVVISPESL